MAVEVAVMPTAHDAVSPVIYTQNAWPSQPLSPVDQGQGQYAPSPVGSVASPHNSGSPLSHANSPLGVCSPTAVQSPHMQAHSPAMQAGSPLHCQQPMNINVNVKQELSGADYANCNNLTHLLRVGPPPDFTATSFASGLSCHMGPPAQREILDGEDCNCSYTITVYNLHCETRFLFAVVVRLFTAILLLDQSSPYEYQFFP